jgi:hypothetical protein
MDSHGEARAIRVPKQKKNSSDRREQTSAYMHKKKGALLETAKKGPKYK